MPQQHELVAVLEGNKKQLDNTVKDLYQQLDRADQFSGFAKKYSPADEAGEKLPDDKKLPIAKVKSVALKAAESWIRLMDLVVSVDAGNQICSSDIIVDGKVIAKAVPATTLLFLLKRLEDIRSFVSKLPTPDPSEVWTYDENSGQLVSATTDANRTKKVPMVITKAQATPQHPAQTELIQEDKTVGTWRTTKYSTGIPFDKKEEILERIKKLLDAVRIAKQNANNTAVEQKRIGHDLMSAVFGDAIAL